jgi:hypothetical protein
MGHHPLVGSFLFLVFLYFAGWVFNNKIIYLKNMKSLKEIFRRSGKKRLRGYGVRMPGGEIRDNLGRQEAIDLDKKVLWVPRVYRPSDKKI